jgi:hypothetical protein
MDILELTLHTMKPVTESGAVVVTGSSISFYNAGDSTVTIDNHWTIPAGGTFQIGVSDERKSIITSKIKVVFSGGTTNNLQIILLVPKGKEFSNYIQQ